MRMYVRYHMQQWIRDLNQLVNRSLLASCAAAEASGGSGGAENRHKELGIMV